MDHAHADRLDETLGSLGAVARSLGDHGIAVAGGRTPDGAGEALIGLRSGRVLTVVAIDELPNRISGQRLDASFRIVERDEDGMLHALRVNVSDVETVTATGSSGIPLEIVAPAAARAVLKAAIAAIPVAREGEECASFTIEDALRRPDRFPFTTAALRSCAPLARYVPDAHLVATSETRLADLPDEARLPLVQTVAKDVLFEEAMVRYRPYCDRAEWLSELQRR